MGETQFFSLAELHFSGVTAKVDVAILCCLKKYGGMTRLELGMKIGRRLSTICGRVHWLQSKGFLQVTGKKIDKSSGRWVEILELNATTED